MKNLHTVICLLHILQAELLLKICFKNRYCGCEKMVNEIHNIHAKSTIIHKNNIARSLYFLELTKNDIGLVKSSNISTLNPKRYCQSEIVSCL